ncbi:hypothetical protein BDV06DRAFT_43878 [Aspergillus oleicola]
MLISFHYLIPISSMTLVHFRAACLFNFLLSPTYAPASFPFMLHGRRSEKRGFGVAITTTHRSHDTMKQLESHEDRRTGSKRPSGSVRLRGNISTGQTHQSVVTKLLFPPFSSLRCSLM